MNVINSDPSKNYSEEKEETLLLKRQRPNEVMGDHPRSCDPGLQSDCDKERHILSASSSSSSSPPENKPTEITTTNTQANPTITITTNEEEETIGIPTTGPRGILFATRLEAHWAYVFDAMGFSWEYQHYPPPSPRFRITIQGTVKPSQLFVIIQPDLSPQTWKQQVPGLIANNWSGHFIALGASYRLSAGLPTLGVQGIIDPKIDEKTSTLTCRKMANVWSLEEGDVVDQDTAIVFERIWTTAKNTTQYIQSRTSDGIPTVGPRAIQFRSRLEAQWAHIFEQMHFKWEYEPFDLKQYIPDFILMDSDQPLLVEIKPATNIPKTYDEKYDLSWKDYIDKIIASGWQGNFVILGAAYRHPNNTPVIGLGGSTCQLENIHVMALKKFSNKWEIIEEQDKKKVDINTLEQFQAMWVKSKQMIKSSNSHRAKCLLQTVQEMQQLVQTVWPEKLGF